ncbi:DHHA1 domain-containing protein [Salinicoccus sp. CNSTN-B1]
MELLLEDERHAAYEMAMTIENMNAERKQLVIDIFGEAVEQIRTENQINIAYADGWHPGVLGIVASRIVEEFGKPAIVLTRDGDSYRGSGRSIEGLDLHDIITRQSTHYTHFGDTPKRLASRWRQKTLTHSK